MNRITERAIFGFVLQKVGFNMVYITICPIHGFRHSLTPDKLCGASAVDDNGGLGCSLDQSALKGGCGCRQLFKTLLSCLPGHADIKACGVNKTCHNIQVFSVLMKQNQHGLASRCMRFVCFGGRVIQTKTGNRAPIACPPPLRPRLHNAICYIIAMPKLMTF